MNTKHVLILGGGFAGLACAKGLRDERFAVTLVDRWNHRFYSPRANDAGEEDLAQQDG